MAVVADRGRTVKLPEIEYGPVQTVSQELPRLDAAQRRAAGVISEGLTRYGMELVKVESQAAAADLAEGLATIEGDLTSRRYVSTKELRDALGGDLGSLPPGLRERVTQKALDINTGEMVEADRDDIPTWEVAGVLFDRRAKQLLDTASQRVSAQGWRSEFQAKAQEELASRKLRLAGQQAQAMHADLEDRQEAHIAQLSRLRQWDDAIAAIDRSAIFGVGKKAQLTETVLKQKQAWDEQEGAIAASEEAFAEGVANGSKVVDETKAWARLDAAAAERELPASSRRSARELLRQRINDFDESRKAEVSRVFAVALQAFQAPDANGRPRNTVAVIPSDAVAYLTDPANGKEAADLWNSLLAKEKAERATDRTLANTPTAANWAAYGALVKDMSDNPSKYRGMDGARFTAEVYGQVGPLIDKAMTAYKGAVEPLAMDKRVLNGGERTSILEALPPKYRPSKTTKPGSLEGRVWSLVQERIGERKAREWEDERGPVPPAILKQWVAEEWAAGTVPGGRYWGLLDEAGVPKVVAEAQGRDWRPDGKPAPAATAPRLQGRLTGGPVRIKSDAEYNALPAGTEFIDPNGKRRRKP